MPIRPIKHADLPQVLELYNNVVEPVNHGFPAGADEFSAAFRGMPSYLKGGLALVAEQAGRCVGMVRAGTYARIPERVSFAADGDGLVFGPFFTHGHAHVGPALLDAALEHLAKTHVPRVCAFDPVECVGAPFYNAGWAGLSERLPQMVALFARSGFRLRHRELCLTRPAMGPPLDVEAAPPWRVDHQPRGRDAFVAHLRHGAVDAGNCQYSRIHPGRSRHADARSWGYIDGLFISEAYRGNGFGRLILGQALGRLAAMGCGPVCLTTASENLRAQNLYLSLGFTLVDSCITLVHETS